MRRLAVATAVALTAVGTAATPAAALPHQRVAHAPCGDNRVDISAGAGDRLGPFSWSGHWDSYAVWPTMEQQRDPRDGTIYAKYPMYLRRGTVASLSIAPAYRRNADFVYGGRAGRHVLSEVVRFRSCANSTTFYSGGLVVTGATCVMIEARVRGDRRVHRKMISINMGANCAAAPRAVPRPTVAYARCDDAAPQRQVVPARERFGPVSFLGNWEGYAEWANMERLRARDGTLYAKNGITVRSRVVGSLAIAPAYRASADFVYGRGPNGSSVLSDVVRVQGCPRGAAFFSGGLIVRGPTCVLIEARQRGSRRVDRKMVSINMGANCRAP
jgi:hypothetical protein